VTAGEKQQRILAMLKQVASRRDLEVLEATLETSAAPAPVREGGIDPSAVRANIQNLLTREPADLSPDDLFAAEAIIIPEKRPPALIREGSYDDFTGDWVHLNSSATRVRLKPVIAAVGRIEMPGVSSRPYAGTGFIAGPGLLMTNRHVANLFASGIGDRGLIYRKGAAAVDFMKEVSSRPEDSYLLDVERVVMIHPYWDMAILAVKGLPGNVAPLQLAIDPPSQLRKQEVAAIGYPAFDPRNDATVQKQVFSNVFEVKRLQPGLLLERGARWSFGKFVQAVTHDCSTLGGNSGSAVVLLGNGSVAGLHFSGDYLKSNYAVPAYELARDRRVVAAGVSFASGSLPEPSAEWEEYWKAAGSEFSAGRGTSKSTKGRTVAMAGKDGSMKWVIPIRVTILVGGAATDSGQGAVVAPDAPVAPGGEESFQIPIIFDGLETRNGFDPAYLELADGDETPLPPLTAAGKNVAATIDDGSHELKYHHFSVVMHRTRRLAMYTASNVDWRLQHRLVDGKKPTREQLTGIPEGVSEQWVTDSRLPEEHQLPDIFFTKDRRAFDKGHLVRRDDVTWGTDFEDMQMANGDTYHTTNCSPQTMQFNQGSRGVDNWGDLEAMVEKQTKAEKAIVLNGPVLRNNDRRFFGVSEQGQLVVRIPSEYWKMIVVKAEEGPRVYAFKLKQDLSKVDFGKEEMIVPESWQRFLVPVAEIEQALRGWVDLSWYKQFDQVNSDESVAIAEGLR